MEEAGGARALYTSAGATVTPPTWLQGRFLVASPHLHADTDSFAWALGSRGTERRRPVGEVHLPWPLRPRHTVTGRSRACRGG